MLSINFQEKIAPTLYPFSLILEPLFPVFPAIPLSSLLSLAIRVNPMYVL